MYYNYLSDTQSLYIHWPFCPYKCHFCPFVALAGQDQFMEQYHTALMREIEAFVRQSSKKHTLQTIYFGGGTPSTYPTHLLLDMVSILKDGFDFLPGIEITIEVNPGTVNLEQLQAWKRMGINRLSIGVQSLKDSVLKKLNRHQSIDDVHRVLAWADGLFENVSVDFILGLPDVSAADWKGMLDTTVIWPINHISVYFLTVHENTPLYFRIKQQLVELPCDDETVDLYHWTREILVQNNFKQYEVSSFARPGYESVHNRAYWNRKPFKGFGLGAWSFDGAARFENEKNLLTYMKTAQEGGNTAAVYEVLTVDQVRLEKIMLGIRQIKGVLLEDIMNDLSKNGQERLWTSISLLQEQGLISMSDNHIVITPRGLSVENMIAQKLFFA
jgi:oxygen-independent coproporphyrinogen-3 oxidase